MLRNAGLTGLLLLTGGLAAGCGRTCYLQECDYNHYHTDLGLPNNLESNPHEALVPSPGTSPAPTTINDADRKLRYMSLPEAIAIALEQGNTGSQSPLFPGIANDGLVQFSGRSVGGDDNIRVLALDPAILGADIDSALSKFDARWITSATWNKNDTAGPTALGPNGVSAQTAQNGDTAQVSTGIYKPLPTGGVTGITLSTDYNLLNNVAFNGGVNPTYRPRAQVVFEQPLLQGFGVEINQLTTSHPGSLLVPGLRSSGGQRVEGIIITRLRFDQGRAEFERNLTYQLLNVEYAYWNLYGSYFTLFSREQGLRQAFEAYKLNRARFDVGRIPIQDLEQTRAQYELFRAQRITAFGQVLDNERQLRGLLGLPIEDGTRIVPSDQPVLSQYKPDWVTARDESIALRPELILARQELKFRQLDLIQQKNFLLPDLRFGATYDVNGLGNRLDGSGPNPDGTGNALKSLADNQFNNWSLTLRMDVPIGTRDAYAAVRQARLNLTRSYLQLKDQELKSERFLARQYRQVVQYYEEIGAQRAQRIANANQLEARFKEYQAGRGTLDILLEAQRNFADALAAEYTAIVNYNNAICGFQFAKGTLLQYNNVNIAEGGLPCCAQVRATEHLREKAAALVLRERPAPGNEHHAPSTHEGLQGEVPTALPVVQQTLPPAPTGPLPPNPPAIKPPETLPVPIPASAGAPTAAATPPAGPAIISPASAVMPGPPMPAPAPLPVVPNSYTPNSYHVPDEKR